MQTARLTCDPSEWIASGGSVQRLVTADSSFFISLTDVDRRAGAALVRMGLKAGFCSPAGPQEGDDRPVLVTDAVSQAVRRWAPFLDDPIHVLAAQVAALDDAFHGICWSEPGSDYASYLVHPPKLDRWQLVMPGQRLERASAPMYLTSTGMVRQVRTWPEDVVVTDSQIEVVDGPDPQQHILSFGDGILFQMNIDADAVRLGDWRLSDAVRLRGEFTARLKPVVAPEHSASPTI
ncbi:hypothetical protein BSY19_5229 (plasmid) [Bosea sp. RAC05]|nr:hypothetical protein BSY19_5229 [Bosea sp. RAC05]